MSRLGHPIHILIVEDDEDDQILIREAFAENFISNPIFFVNNGDEMLQFLSSRKNSRDKKKMPLPGLILLDLNLPGKDGREALADVKSDPDLRRIPIIIFTTSKAEEDIIKSYDLGVAGFITKPVTFQGLMKIVQVIKNYWLTIVELPMY